MDDAQLLKAYAEEKSEAAFAELVRRHVDLVYSAALRQVGGDPHRAQEAAQGVFLDLARKARALAGHPALAGWLYTSTFYATAKLMRAERRRTLRERQAAATAAACDTPAADWQRVQPVLDAAMHALGGPERNAIVLRFFEQRPMTEVGRLLGLSESGARKNVERGLDRLRVELGRRGIASAPAALSLALASHAVGAAPAGLAATISQGACAGAAGGGVLAFIFMSTIKMQVGVAAAVLAAGGWWLAKRQEAGQLAAPHRSAPAAVLGMTTATPRTGAGPSAMVKAGATSADQSLATETSQADVDPREAAERAAHTSVLSGLFAALFDKMPLTPAERPAFMALLIEARRSALDAVRLGRAASLKEGEAFAKLVRDAALSKDGELRALLGDRRFAQFAGYRGVLEEQTTVRRLQAKLAETGQTLSVAQGAELMRIYAETQKPRLGYSPETAALLQTTGISLNARIVALWKPVLTETQAAVLQQLQAEDANGSRPRVGAPPSR